MLLYYRLKLTKNVVWIGNEESLARETHNNGISLRGSGFFLDIGLRNGSNADNRAHRSSGADNGPGGDTPRRPQSPLLKPKPPRPPVGDDMAGPEYAPTFAEYWKPPTDYYGQPVYGGTRRINFEDPLEHANIWGPLALPPSCGYPSWNASIRTL
jgi:hypothetical protein